MQPVQPVTRLPILLVAASLTGCSADRGRAATAHLVSAIDGRLARVPAATEHADGDDDRAPRNKGARRKGKGRFGNAGAYVDGRFVGMLKFNELPPALRTTYRTLDDGRQVQRFSLVQYLRSVGVRLERVQAVHFHGGRNRVSIVAGSELRRVGDALMFSFTRGQAGKARVEYPDLRMVMNTSVDKLTGLAVYVDRTPPTYDRQTRTLSIADHKVTGMAYATAERHGGTRVYLDGQFMGSVQRRLVEGDAPMLAELFDALAVPHQQVTRMQLISTGEKIVADVQQPNFAATPFEVARRSRGRIAITSMAADAKLEAI